jgi:hypothetical protein
MSNNTHTPGPWTVRNEHFRPLAILSADRASIIARLPDTAPKSDARLIAAAPEMLEALETAKLDMYAAWVLAKDLGDKPSIDHCSKSLSRVSNAIAKAKGL